MLKKEFSGLVGRLGEVPLALIGTVSVAAVKSFRAADYFKDGEVTDGLRVWLSDDFKKYLLGKTESDVPAAELRIQQLERKSQDGPILEELGGKGAAETFLAWVWQLLKLQPMGEEGKLLVDGRAAVFYVRDVNETCRAVRSYWRAPSREWLVWANPVPFPHVWDAGCQVISR